MIKEIEVGGVKHSITLADDMIGSGLMRTVSGKVCLNLPTMPVGERFMTGLTVESGLLVIDKYALSFSMSGSGLAVDGNNRLFVDVNQLAGSGLTPSPDRKALNVTATGLLSEPDFMNAFASGLIGSGLVNTGGRLSVSGMYIGTDPWVIQGVSSGLLAAPDFSYLLASGMAPHLAGTGLTDFYGKLSINRDLFGSGLHFDPGESIIFVTVGSGVTVDESLHDKPVCVKIAKRDTGLRLFFNSENELDVTQD